MKKTLALLLVVFTLVAQLTMVTVSADGATVTVETVEAAAGEPVEVDVVLTGCDGFTDLSLEFGYDPDVLTLLSTTNGVDGLKPTTAKAIDTIPYNVAWNSADSVSHEGTVITLEFEIAAEAASGTYPITVDFYKGRNGNFKDGVDCNINMDEDFNVTSLNLTYVDGAIVIPAAVVPDTPTIPEFTEPSSAYVKVQDYPEFVEPGDVFELTVDLKNCDVFTDLSLEFGYDTDAFTLLSTTNGVDGLKPTTAKAIDTIPYNVAWNSADPVEHSGTIITLEFEVNAAAVTGTYDFTVDFYKGRFGNFKDGVDCNINMDEDFNITPLNLTYCNGVVSVKGAAAPVVPTEYALDAVVAGNGVDITAEGPAMDGKIIAALYNGKKLAQVKIFDAAATVNATFTQSGDKIKVMWWDGMLTAKPLCDSVELPLD